VTRSGAFWEKRRRDAKRLFPVERAAKCRSALQTPRLSEAVDPARGRVTGAITQATTIRAPRRAEPTVYRPDLARDREGSRRPARPRPISRRYHEDSVGRLHRLRSLDVPINHEAARRSGGELRNGGGTHAVQQLSAYRQDRRPIRSLSRSMASRSRFPRRYTNCGPVVITDCGCGSGHADR